jgi:hypothetical protein
MAWHIIKDSDKYALLYHLTTAILCQHVISKVDSKSHIRTSTSPYGTDNGISTGSIFYHVPNIVAFKRYHNKCRIYTQKTAVLKKHDKRYTLYFYCTGRYFIAEMM